MTTMTASEQMLLEMTNRARMDPAAEAARLGIDLNQYIQQSSSGYPITTDAKQVLAGNNTLQGVAERHANVVWNNPNFGKDGFDAHNGAGDGSVSDRIAQAGYAQNPLSWYRNENFALQQTSEALTAAQIQTLVERSHNGLFIDDPANSFGEPGGHRLAMMDPNMKEMGSGTVTGSLQGWNTLMTFENFGVTGSNSFLTGAVYNDTVRQDRFYTMGEGVSGVTATVTSAAGATLGSDVTGSGGGWSVAQPGGTSTVTFSGGGLARAVSATVEAGSLNAKVDLVDGARIESNVNTTLGAGAQDLRLIGMGNVAGTGNASANAITGNKGANLLNGKGGNDTLDGAAGDDTAVLSGNKADYSVTVLSGTSARFTDLRGGAPDGTDTILNIEHVKFADQTVNFGDLRTTSVPAPKVGSIAINNVSISEGNGGTKVATFTVSRTGGSAAFDVDLKTGNNTATTADGDYVSKSGTLHFAAGVNTQTFSVTVRGDTKVEANETFKVWLTGATNGGTIADGLGYATITNDDVQANRAPVVTAQNATVASKTAVAVSSMFTAHDQDGDATIVKYALWDAGTGGGHLTVGGVAQAAGKWIYVDAAKLGTVKYVGGTVPGAETLHVTASDGKAWSPTKSLTVKTVDNPAGDFNGDGASDVLWHSDGGKVAMWQMDGEHVALNKIFAGLATSWHVEATEDFGGDGKSDVLLHNDNGAVTLWQMDGARIASSQVVGKTAAGWDIAAVDDFNADGKADILLTNAAGKVAMWQMDGAKIVANTTFGQVGQGWHIEDAADFTGDGKADILLRHGASGDVAMWKMNGAHVDSVKTFGTIGTTWDFAGTGDFGGDGKADILWRHDGGNVALWQMNGTTVEKNNIVGGAATSWKVADIGDYDRDGHSDILWHGSAGKVAMWQMDGAHIDANVGVGSIGTDWHI